MDRVELSRLLWVSLGYEPGKIPPPEDPRVLVSSNNQLAFRAVLASAVAARGEVFLGNPAWGENERAQLASIFSQPIAPYYPKPFPIASSSSSMAMFPDSMADASSRGWLMVPTGGTSGQLRFARHDEHTLAAAVAGFTQHFSLDRVNAVGVLPHYHVSGLMAWMRCALTGGEYRALDWKAVEAGERMVLPEKADGWMISLVPTQLERLLRQRTAVDWLRQFRIIFVGGGPARPDLLDEAAGLGLRLSLGYGMTETAAMVAVLRPEEFLVGERTCGSSMPHARIRVATTGAIEIAGASLFRGYYPDWRTDEWFVTADVGNIKPSGHLTVSGRRDDVIISGGEKIDPAEVAQVLRACGQFSDLAVLGIPDGEWGQIVVVAYPAGDQPEQAQVDAAAEKLAPSKRPKRFVPLCDWPRTEHGKLNQRELLLRVQLQMTRN